MLLKQKNKNIISKIKKIANTENWYLVSDKKEKKNGIWQYNFIFNY